MPNQSYYIRPGYKPRGKNAPYVDVQPTGITYQPDIYELAIFLVRTGGFKYLIDIGAGSGQKLKPIAKEVSIIAIDYDPNIKALKKNLPNAEVISFNLEKGLPKLAPEIVKEAVIISVDVIEHIVKPHRYLKDISALAQQAPFILISTPDRSRARGPDDYGPPANPFHVREWTTDELYTLFKQYKFNSLIGHSISNDREKIKATSLAIGGRLAIFNPQAPKKSVLAIMTVYNEADILEQSIKHVISQGCDLHIIDNWSTDDSFNTVKKLAKVHKNISFERFPKVKTSKHNYKWRELLNRVEAVAKASKHDWVLHNDADEFRLSPWKNVNLQQAISFVDYVGYNAIDFTVADFRPTKDGYKGKESPDEFFFDFEFTGLSGYFVQIKGWKNTKDVQLASSGGHQAVFNERKVFPLKFFGKHYPLRSSQQAKRKIFKDRLPRLIQAEKKIGWHIQYNTYDKKDTFIWAERGLNKYTVDNFYDEYIVERLSGVGIKRIEDN